MDNYMQNSMVCILVVFDVSKPAPGTFLKPPIIDVQLLEVFILPLTTAPRPQIRRFIDPSVFQKSFHQRQRCGQNYQTGTCIRSEILTILFMVPGIEKLTGMTLLFKNIPSCVRRMSINQELDISRNIHPHTNLKFLFLWYSPLRTTNRIGWLDANRRSFRWHW